MTGPRIFAIDTIAAGAPYVLVVATEGGILSKPFDTIAELGAARPSCRRSFAKRRSGTPVCRPEQWCAVGCGTSLRRTGSR